MPQIKGRKLFSLFLVFLNSLRKHFLSALIGFREFLSRIIVLVHIFFFFLWRYIWNLGKHWTLWAFLVLDIFGVIYVLLPINWNIPYVAYSSVAILLFIIANVDVLRNQEYKIITKSQKRYIGHTFKINSIDISPDDTRIATSSDRVTIIWDTSTTDKIQRLQSVTWIGESIFVKQGQEVVGVGGRGLFYHWLVSDGSILTHRTIQQHSLFTLAIRRDEKYLAVAGELGIIALYTFPSMQKITEYSMHKAAIRKISYSSNNVLAACDDVGNVALFSPSGAKIEVFRHPKKEPIRHIAFSKDGNKLAFVDGVGYVYYYDVLKMKMLQYKRGHDDMGLTCVFNSSGDFLATGGQDNKIIIWKTYSEKLVKLFTLEGHNDAVNYLIFEKGKNNLFSAGRDKRVCYWRIKHLLFSGNII